MHAKVLLAATAAPAATLRVIITAPHAVQGLGIQGLLGSIAKEPEEGEEDIDDIEVYHNSSENIVVFIEPQLPPAYDELSINHKIEAEEQQRQRAIQHPRPGPQEYS